MAGKFDESKFSPPSSQGINSLSQMSLTGTGGGGNMKQRLLILEDALESQTKKNLEMEIRMNDILNESISNSDRLNKMLQDNRERFEDSLNALRKEFAHKFDLQMAENQRTLQHISSLKADKTLLQKKLVRVVGDHAQVKYIYYFVVVQFCFRIVP